MKSCSNAVENITTYVSPQRQNELIMLLEEEIRAIINDKVNQSGFCSVMANTTPDVSHSDELSVAVRFVDSEIWNQKSVSSRSVKQMIKLGKAR
jgi:hypothetical protein